MNFFKTYKYCFNLRNVNQLYNQSLLEISPKLSKCIHFSKRLKSSHSDDKSLSNLVQPIPITPCVDPDGINIGEELTGTILKDDLITVINKFYNRHEIKRLAAESGLDSNLFHKAFVGFRRFCLESEHLPSDLHVIISDILQNAGHVDDIFPYFIRHAKTMYPHLDCMEDLRKISDLRQPANWYSETRSIQRKIIYHAGPTNSGKTHQAFDVFLSAKSGIYCGPLRLLATEIFKKANALGTPCDLITGEERKFANLDNNPANHIACTVEMSSVNQHYEVAIIDEIQMLRDVQRGWAWTRAFLGINAEEVHVCGEESGIELIRDLALTTGDTIEIRKYKRLTNLKILDKALGNFDNVKTGDCIVCFNKNDIYNISRQLEKRGIEIAVIYGALPPGTKLAQAMKFNDPENSCNVMVATDAIGMGLNLSIKRIIFYSLMKPYLNEKGEKEMDFISPSTALQISGRAGRYLTQFNEGEVTTFKMEDLPMLKKLLNTPVEQIQQAGLHPTAEQIELFAYHLPKATFTNLIDIFVTLSQLDDGRYFMCNIDDFKFLADMIEHIPLQLRVRYVFCCSPIPKKQPFVCAMFLKFARQFSRGVPLTLHWLCQQIGWPFQHPQTINDLVHLEAVFDILDLYLWLSYRFTDMFPDVSHIRDMQSELDEIIQSGVYNIVKLLNNTENLTSTSIVDNDDDLIDMLNKQRKNSALNRSTSNKKGIDASEDLKSGVKSSLTTRFMIAKEKQAGKFSEQLLKKGLITREELNKLQEQFANDIQFNDDK